MRSSTNKYLRLLLWALLSILLISGNIYAYKKYRKYQKYASAVVAREKAGLVADSFWERDYINFPVRSKYKVAIIKFIIALDKAKYFIFIKPLKLLLANQRQKGFALTLIIRVQLIDCIFTF